MIALENTIEEAEAWTLALQPQPPANVIAFPVTAKSAPVAPEPVAVNVAPVRSPREWVTTADLRALLKSKLGYNAKQVSAKCRHSQQYLDLTIRDAGVDVAAVTAFAATLDSWSMDQTDYCTGQSVNVSTTGEVDAIHAAPFIEEAKSAVAKIMASANACGTKLANGKYLWKNDHEYYVLSDLNGGKRGCYIQSYEVENGTQWAIAALALQIARV